MGNTSCCCSSSAPQQDYQDVIEKLIEVGEMSHIDELISYIDELLNAIDQRRVNSIAVLSKTNRVTSSITSGGTLLEKILQRSNRHICKRDTMPMLNRETRKLVIDITKEAAQIQWVGIALSVVGFVLEHIEQVSSNRDECIVLLKYMCNLAKYIKRLDDHLSEEKLKRVIRFVVEGSLLCISQMQSHALYKFFAAPVAAEDLRRLQAQLGQEYSELSLESIITVLNRSAEVLNRIPVVLPPSQGISPQAVGIEEARTQVTKLLDMENKSVKVVVIYGQGGIGKTTLASAVFSNLDLKIYNICRVDMEQNCSEADLKSAQQQILDDLYDQKIQLRSLSEGREVLSKDFKEHSSKPVFIFVDNALKQSDLEKLLPITGLASLPPQSRILLTTRNLNETRIILEGGVERCPYLVASLPQEEAHKFLCKLALGDDQASFDPIVDINGLLQICQGIPLVLKMAGARLYEHAQSMPDCRNVVESLKSELLQGEEDDLSKRMVDFVYNRLKASCKEAFLDIVFFFCNWRRRRVACSVGETEFEELERAALVNISDEGRVNVHDIVKARGRMLSGVWERITDQQSLNDVLQDKERIKRTKGIVLVDEAFELEADHLNLMKICLRVLILTGRTRIVNGECRGVFDNLRLVSLDNYNNYSRMDVSKHPRLAAFILKYDGDSNFPEFTGTIPSSLRYMCIKDATLVNLTTTLSQNKSLHSLTLRGCRGLDSLPKTIDNILALEKLSLKFCDSLVNLPYNFGKISCLKKLSLSSCSSLVSLPDSVGNLSSLNSLDLSSCSSLVSLPDSVGNLSSLNSLDLRYCSSLVSLPDSVGNLSSLNSLDLRYCSSLVSLPDSVGNLSSLNSLHLSFCSSLVSLPDSVGNLSSLNSLHLSFFSSLVSLPDSVGNLSSLNSLHLSLCSSLVSLPDSVGNLSSLNSLDLSSCSSLVSLPDSVGNLSSLNSLHLIFCSSLVSLLDSVGNLSSLNSLDLSSCSSLVSLPDSVGNLSSLKSLGLSSCSSLVSLPDSVGNLSSLKSLYLSSCSSLVSLPDSVGNLSSLNSLDLRYCSSLVSLPDSVGNLSSLNSLDLSSCSVSLPDSVGNLSSLNSLHLSFCSSLVSLPDSVGNLSSLNSLRLSCCSSLVSLPDSVGNLSSLNSLDLSCCSSLVSLPDSVGNLSSLNSLDLSCCSSLVSLPDSVGNLSSLNSLDLSCCSSLVSLPDSVGNLSSLNSLDLSSCSSLVSLPDSVGNLSSLNSLDLSSCSSLVSLPDSVGNLSSLVYLYLIRCTQLSLLPESFGNLASLELLVLEDCEKLSNLPQNFGQLNCLKCVSIHGCSALQSLSGDFECLSSLIAVKASECPQLEETTMDKLAKLKGLIIVDIDGSPILKKRWEQVKEKYSLAVVECGRKEFEDKMYPHADVMCRAFFHSESRFVSVDEDGQLVESPSPAGGVNLWFLLKERDVRSSSSSNGSCWEAVKKQWMELVASDGGQMIYVDMGGSWEERETRAQQVLHHLPSNTRAWIAPDNRARLAFAYSVRHYYYRHVQKRHVEAKLGVGNCVVSTSACVDEEGRRKLDDLNFILPDLSTPPFAETKYETISDELLSPIKKAMRSLSGVDNAEGVYKLKWKFYG
ncbi:disease resistance protein RPV1-like [Cryptomeria japonica]|uniref:disease resistance protein RPV1-like n=1 Tax=Cryptomeria japonica TaxID=3369 RepID=UPI0027DA5BC9|nr:disease resistance protein RPV1-like [Cryptomeria japonica]